MAQGKKTRDKGGKDSKAQDKQITDKSSTTVPNRRPLLADLSRILAPGSRPSNGLLSSPKPTDSDVDNESPHIETLVNGRIEVFDLTREAAHTRGAWLFARYGSYPFTTSHHLLISPRHPLPRSPWRACKFTRYD